MRARFPGRQDRKKEPGPQHRKLGRRELLGAAGAAALAACFPLRRTRAEGGVELNDVHSELNATRVERVLAVHTREELRAAILEAAHLEQAVSIAGGRHSMGGQQFGTGTLNLDLRPFEQVLELDRQRGLVRVEAGIRWPELLQALERLQPDADPFWTFRQKQTGADALTIGGALAANAHGRGLCFPPLISDVESFELVGPRGGLLTCSRSENPELFGLVIGGWGLFGVVASVELRLVPRTRVERLVELRSSDGLIEAFDERVAQGCTYGDFQFEIDERSPHFMERGVFACYRPLADAAGAATAQHEEPGLRGSDWVDLIVLAHTDKSEAFRRYAAHYLATNGQTYGSDTHQLGVYPEGYHKVVDERTHAARRATEMISELYVPRGELTGFLRAAAAWLRACEASLIYGTVRLIEKDEESFLPWARERFACTVLNLHVVHTPEGLAQSRRAFRGLIDLALERGGSFYLAYHRWASREQVLAAYPAMPAFLERKLHYDPDARFQSEWYRHHKRLLA
jgi:FAD/FMN-containing dehydrogenase